jgi:hypothetical protein
MVTFDEIDRTSEAAVPAYLKLGLRWRDLPTGTEKICGNFGQNNRRPDSNDAKHVRIRLSPRFSNIAETAIFFYHKLYLRLSRTMN